MPGPIIPKPVLVCKPRFQSAEGTWSNVMYAEVTGVVGGSEDVLALVDAISTGFAEKALACMSEEVNYLGMDATYTTSTKEWFANSGNGNGQGARDGECMPIQDCFEVRKYTDSPGRAGRGRYFFSGLSEDDTQNGHLLPTAYTPFNALAAYLGASVVVGDRTVNWRHWNRKLNILQVITQCKTIRRLVSQRSRAKKEPYIPILN